MPHSRSVVRDQVVAVQGWPGSSRFSGASKNPAGKNAPPAHSPVSGSWWSSSLAPKPSWGMRARVASHTSGGWSSRSRSTCQRREGSVSRSQETTSVGATLGSSPRTAARATPPAA